MRVIEIREMRPGETWICEGRQKNRRLQQMGKTFSAVSALDFLGELFLLRSTFTVIYDDV